MPVLKRIVPSECDFSFFSWLYGKYLCYYEGFIAYFVGMIGLYLLTTLSLNR